MRQARVKTRVHTHEQLSRLKSMTVVDNWWESAIVGSRKGIRVWTLNDLPETKSEIPVMKAIETCLLCELKLIDIWIFLSIEINICHCVSEISNTQDFVTFCMHWFPSRSASSANTTSGIKSLRDFQSKGREHELELSWMSFVKVFCPWGERFSYVLNFICSSASSTQSVSQVQQELANTRQEAEKLSTENESLSKNYESLLKVTGFLYEIW